ncbi:MAG: type II toxin-antitoxin system prevent-host-death family antitoxin [Acidimicrobiales bacterium]
MDVGVRDLKAHLSQYLERAAGGEVITVTDRGRPIALLAPIPGRVPLDQGIKEGWICAPSLRGLRPARPVTSSRNVLDVLEEDRGE